jgi:hypothetical protein
MAGLSSVTLDTTLNNKAMQAALMMDAQGTLSQS